MNNHYASCTLSELRNYQQQLAEEIAARSNRTIEIQTVNCRQAFKKVNGIDEATSYVEVMLRVSVTEEDLFESFSVVEDRVKEYVKEKLK